ncbi:MAG: MFS transporter [Bacteroidetes bacterium]|nr:MFS transporter [Bacteroidota bacterium]
MLGLEQHQQAAFVGVRSTFYRIAMITGQGVLVVVAGQLETNLEGNIAMAWAITFGILAGLFLLFFIYHKFILPYPVSDTPAVRDTSRSPMAEFFNIFVLFFKKKNIGAAIAFLLLYRFAEAQLVKLVSPFLLDARTVGGIGLTTSEVGIVYGTVGIIALTLGGLLGGYVVSRHGLKFWLWPMVFIIHTPDLAFVYLSQMQPENFILINLAVAVEQFGYGFGFTAYMLYMILIADGEHKTAHYAICTGFMALGMMIPGMFSGAVQEWLGYQGFFIWVILSTIPGFLVATLVKVPAGFGKKAAA